MVSNTTFYNMAVLCPRQFIVPNSLQLNLFQQLSAVKYWTSFKPKPLSVNMCWMQIFALHHKNRQHILNSVLISLSAVKNYALMERAPIKAQCGIWGVQGEQIVFDHCLAFSDAPTHRCQATCQLYQAQLAQSRFNHLRFRNNCRDYDSKTSFKLNKIKLYAEITLNGVITSQYRIKDCLGFWGCLTEQIEKEANWVFFSREIM